MIICNEKLAKNTPQRCLYLVDEYLVEEIAVSIVEYPIQFSFKTTSAPTEKLEPE